MSFSLAIHRLVVLYYHLWRVESIPLYQKKARIPNKDQQRYVGYKERGRIGERSNRRAKLQNTLSFYTLINHETAENNTK